MKSPEIYPVVHINSTDQALRQSEVAFNSSADGVYLIDHNFRSPDFLLQIFNKTKAEFPDKVVGVNFLTGGLSSFQIIHEALEGGTIDELPDAVWVDDAVSAREKTQQYRESHPDLNKVKYLGGVAFKYTNHYTDDPVQAAALATDMAKYVDVVTTSGPGTGKSTSPEKTKAIKRALGGGLLAVASGISQENIDSFKFHVDHILVATSIETAAYSGVFDKEAMRSLISRAKN